ncbi:hypothetical protein V6N12_069025 [Hibiscus sabdariffa]|uniref:HPt domain-containing protein n=1 Tax=Hibiscus sabdariffa TaxID=183260 RepID=A0ABR2FD37_9ROSI
MAVRKIEVQDVDVKDSEAIILDSSRVPLATATSSCSDNQIEGPPAPMKDESMEVNVDLHENDKVPKTLHPLPVILPSMAGVATDDAIASEAAKFTLHDIFRKVGITEPIRNYFIGNRNSNAVLNLVEHNKPSHGPKYLGNSQLAVTNVELPGHWTCNMKLKYGVPIGMQDRNGNLVLRGEPNWYMIVNLTQNVEIYEPIRDLFDLRGNSFANVTVEIYLSVHSSFLPKAKRNLGKPVELDGQYYKDGADEDLRHTSKNVFVPLTVGGGIGDFTDANGRYYSSLEVASKYFRSEANKISIGSDVVYAAEEYIKSKVMIGKSNLEQISKVYGNQAVVVSIDPRIVYVKVLNDVPFKTIRVTKTCPKSIFLWPNDSVGLKKQKGGVDFVVEIQSSVLKHMPVGFVFKCYKQQIIDFKMMDARVHQLKGSSSSIGAQRVRHLCFVFRNNCEAQNREG